MRLVELIIERLLAVTVTAVRDRKVSPAPGAYHDAQENVVNNTC